MIKKDRLAHVFIAAGIIASIGSDAVAAKIGSYIGLQLGSGSTDPQSFSEKQVYPDFVQAANPIPGSSSSFTGSLDITNFSQKTRDNATVGRLFVGYQFYTNMAIEAGLAKYRNSYVSYDTNMNASSPSSLGETTFIVGSDQRKDRIEQYALDVMVKANMTLSPDFELYAKVGGAMVFKKINEQISIGNISDVEIDGVPDPTAQPTSYSYTKDRRRSNFSPGIAFGANYYMTSDTAFDISYNRIITHFGSNSNLSFIAIGLLYTV